MGDPDVLILIQIKANWLRFEHGCKPREFVVVDQYGSRADGTSIPPTWHVFHEIDIARLVVLHAKLRDLCDELELCADRLPDRQAIVNALLISAALARILGQQVVIENAKLSRMFDTLRPATLCSVSQRVRHRQAMDQLQAEDLCDALAIAAGTIGPVHVDVLSYMMRCLFDGCRRGIDFHEAMILLLARNRMTLAAYATLSASLTGETNFRTAAG